MSNDPIFAAKLAKAKTWPMPLQIEVRGSHGLFVNMFARNTVKQAAEALGLMVQVTIWGTATYMSFGCSFEERQLLIELLREEHGKKSAAQTFFEIVEEAERQFVEAIELDNTDSTAD